VSKITKNCRKMPVFAEIFAFGDFSERKMCPKKNRR
jgi:hypothetical protein